MVCTAWRGVVSHARYMRLSDTAGLKDPALRLNLGPGLRFLVHWSIEHVCAPFWLLHIGGCTNVDPVEGTNQWHKANHH